MKTKRSGFTLIELLTVIAIIALVLGGFGLALFRGGDRGVALQAGQSTLSSLLTGTRGQAILNQTNAMLVVDRDPASEGFLRSFRIAVETPQGSNRWRFVGVPATLPNEIFLVPRDTSYPGVTFGVTYPATSLSTAFVTAAPYGTSGEILDPDGNAHLGSFHRLMGFTQRGVTVPNVGSGFGGPTGTSASRLVLSPARRTAPDAITFETPQLVRGLRVGTYGVATLINEPEGFQ